ncbi:hypothetical protein M3B46_16900 [Sphingobacterium daejeonense]|uniref:hypothetical protein n=2 Tax=Sphingobacterium daejeonense TaxID=371142 RepID=UPI0021A37E20|nr:hypothetical protein [Sphingobacterium daejeonense]MCT1532686.1 hypothetical protein [Sphingobacterium daejeonense]
MKKEYKYILLILLFIIISSCEKGEYLNKSQEFSTIKIDILGDVISPSAVIIDGNKYNSSNFLIPFEEKDSIELSLEFPDQKYNFKKKILNKKGENNVFLFFNNIQDSTITIGPHPLEGVEVPDGYVAVKVMGSNEQFSDENGNLNLGVYDVIGEIVWGQEVNYTKNPVDTIASISNTFPEHFTLIKRPQMDKLVRFKFLNSKYEDILVNGSRVYAFRGFPEDQKVFMFQITEGGALRIRRDPNSGLNNADGGYNVTPVLNYYMSK